MIVLSLLMFIYYLIKMKLLSVLSAIRLKLKTKREGKLNAFVVIEVVNIFHMNLIFFVKSMVSYIKELHPIHYNKIVWQKEKIGHSLK